MCTEYLADSTYAAIYAPVLHAEPICGISVLSPSNVFTDQFRTHNAPVRSALLLFPCLPKETSAQRGWYTAQLTNKKQHLRIQTILRDSRTCELQFGG